MSIFDVISGRRAVQRGIEKRRSPRFTVQGVTTRLGEVADVSLTGMRVLTPHQPELAPGAELALTITDRSLALTLSARVARVKKPALRSKTWQMGVEFVAPSRATLAAVEHLMTYGFFPRNDRAFRSRPAPNGASAGGPGGDAGDPQDAGDFNTPPPPPTVVMGDLYALLGLQRGASEAEIKAAHRALARRLHPDAGGGPDDAQRFAEITKAYRILTDPDLRAAYDAMLVENFGPTPSAGDTQAAA
jgi:DnaJ-domain-containing protein 1